jgi:N-acetylgalactosamine-6-sulfatase
MEALTSMGQDTNTVVIFSSDNGPAISPPAMTAGSTAGLKGRKTMIFQGGVNVPFLVRWPGHVDAGKTDSTSLMSTVDLIPTFCELAGKALPEAYQPDGESFASIFRNQPFHRTKPLFWEWRFHTQSPGKPNSWAYLAVRYGDWKLLADEKRERIELYNIEKDRFELSNLAESNPAKLKELLAMWDQWKSTLPQ